MVPTMVKAVKCLSFRMFCEVERLALAAANNRLRTKDELAAFIDLIPEEEEAISNGFSPGYSAFTSGPYIELSYSAAGDSFIRRAEVLVICWIPSMKTVFLGTRIIHRYPDRVVLLVSEICHTYCRHCAPASRR